MIVRTRSPLTLFVPRPNAVAAFRPRFTNVDVCEMACVRARKNLVARLVDGFLPENMHVHCIRLTAK